MHGVLIDFYVEIPQNQPFLQPPSAHMCPSAHVPMGELGGGSLRGGLVIVTGLY